MRRPRANEADRIARRLIAGETVRLTGPQGPFTANWIRDFGGLMEFVGFGEKHRMPMTVRQLRQWVGDGVRNGLISAAPRRQAARRHVYGGRP